MLKIFQILIIVLSVYSNLNAQNINFLDANLLKGIIANRVDTNNDGKISVNEASAVTDLNLSKGGEGFGIIYLNGIEAFTKLKSLNISYNNIRSVDLSKNIHLQALYCEDTRITNLDLSNNTKLVSLKCGKTGLTTLDVSRNDSLIVLNCLYNTSLKTICVKDISYAENNIEYRKDTTAKWSETCANGLLNMVQVSKSIIYPNPAKDILNVIGDFEKVSIYDNLGNKVIETIEPKFSINSLPMGIYLGVITNKNNQNQSFKLTKE